MGKGLQGTLELVIQDLQGMETHTLEGEFPGITCAFRYHLCGLRTTPSGERFFWMRAKETWRVHSGSRESTQPRKSQDPTAVHRISLLEISMCLWCDCLRVLPRLSDRRSHDV